MRTGQRIHQIARLAGAASVLTLAALVLALGGFAGPAAAQKPTKIGIIGAGKIGGALGEHWVKAGYEVMLSSRHPEQLKPLAEKLGPKASVGTPREAAAFGDVVLISVPYGALPQIGKDYAAELKGKVVLETGNPFPARDGEMANEARAVSTGVASPRHLPGVRLVRAFNQIPAAMLRSEAHRSGEKIGIPLAGDDADALKVAETLVRDAGFEPVVAGGLSRAKEFDAGSPLFGRAIPAGELKAALGVK